MTHSTIVATMPSCSCVQTSCQMEPNMFVSFRVKRSVGLDYTLGSQPWSAVSPRPVPLTTNAWSGSQIRNRWAGRWRGSKGAGQQESEAARQRLDIAPDG